MTGQAATCEVCGGPIQGSNKYGACSRNAGCRKVKRHRQYVANDDLSRSKAWYAAHPLASTHNNMVMRCTNPRATNYDSYGGRGITVYPDWLGKGGRLRFEAWILENLGPKPEGHSLDRKDPDGNYEPGNLKWSDGLTQRANQRVPLLQAEVARLKAELERAREAA